MLLIFLFTLPKAFIVLTYFMHLRFERSLVVLIALVPFILVGLAILPTMTDIRTLSVRNYSQATDIGEYAIDHGGHGGHGGDRGHEAESHDDHDDTEADE